MPLTSSVPGRPNAGPGRLWRNRGSGAPSELPYVIFVTAFDQFAVRAFEVHALDYLLKPFDADRFARTLARIREAVTAAMSSTATLKEAGRCRRSPIRAEEQERPARPTRNCPHVPGRVRVLRAGEIDWVQAAGNYIELHVGTETILLARHHGNHLRATWEPKSLRASIARTSSISTG